MGIVLSISSAGERNRLIVGNMQLVEDVASEFRGAKGIPFDELLAEGRVGLVKAARGSFRNFREYAEQSIRNQLREFISKWQNFDAIAEDEFERYFYEWSIWASAVPAEKWGTLPATAEDLRVAFEEINTDSDALMSAFISLSRREREMIRARFFRDPRQPLDSIARDWKISRWRTVFIIKRALTRLREALDNRRRNIA